MGGAWRCCTGAGTAHTSFAIGQESDRELSGFGRSSAAEACGSSFCGFGGVLCEGRTRGGIVHASSLALLVEQPQVDVLAAPGCRCVPPTDLQADKHGGKSDGFILWTLHGETPQDVLSAFGMLSRLCQAADSVRQPGRRD